MRLLPIKPIKIWAILRDEKKILSDVVMEFPAPKTESEWLEAIGALAQALHQSRPIMLQKHLDQLNRFRRTAFYPSDFLEPVSFGKMEIELFSEEKEKKMPQS